MEDLLIVKRSERLHSRRSQRSNATPMAANLGLVLGAALGVAGAQAVESSPSLGAILGIVLGLALGGILGNLLKTRRPRQTILPQRHYSGFPSPSEENDDSPQEAKH